MKLSLDTRDKIDNLKLRASYGLVGSDETGTDFEIHFTIWIKWN